MRWSSAARSTRRASTTQYAAAPHCRSGSKLIAALHSSGARRIADLGCGDGALLLKLVGDSAFANVIGKPLDEAIIPRSILNRVY